MHTPTPEAEQYFERVKAILAARLGHENAITIDTLCRESGCVRLDRDTGELVPDRRVMEDILETRNAEFPFIVGAGAKGIFAVATAAELNRYLDRGQGRCVKLFIRRRTDIQKAVRMGWPRVGKYFVDPPARPTAPVQVDLNFNAPAPASASEASQQQKEPAHA